MICDCVFRKLSILVTTVTVILSYWEIRCPNKLFKIRNLEILELSDSEILWTWIAFWKSCTRRETNLISLWVIFLLCFFRVFWSNQNLVSEKWVCVYMSICMCLSVGLAVCFPVYICVCVGMCVSVCVSVCLCADTTGQSFRHVNPALITRPSRASEPKYRPFCRIHSAGYARPLSGSVCSL